MAETRDVLITEVALRDGSHAVRHQFTVEQVTNCCKSIGRSKCALYRSFAWRWTWRVISTIWLSLTNEMELIEAAASVGSRQKLLFFLYQESERCHS